MNMKMIPTAVMLAVMAGGGIGALGDDAARQQEAKLIAVLKSDADFQQKALACHELGRISSAEAVPALAALLTDEKLSHWARYGLEPIAGPAVDEALRDALGKAKGLPRVGIITSLGARRDAKAVGMIGACLKESDPVLVQNAARALGTIGTEEAVKQLESALVGAQGANQLAIAEGLLRGAEALSAQGQTEKALAAYDSLRKQPELPLQVRTGAWRGAILTRQKDGLPLLLEAVRSPDWVLVQAAARIALELKDPSVTKLLADELGKLPADRQLLVIEVLGTRQDAAALPVLLGLAKTADKAVRVAAIKAIVQIEDVSVTTTLIDWLKDPEADVAQAAALGLAGLRGEPVDETLIKALESADPALKLKLVEIVGLRRWVKAKPVLGKLMDAEEKTLRVAAIKNYGELANVTDLPGLLEKMVNNTNASELSALEKAVSTICSVAEDPNVCTGKLVAASDKSVPEAKAVLLKILWGVGNPEALKAVRAAVDDPNKEVHGTAVRLLSDWKTTAAVPLLLELAKNSTAPVDRILALRGCLGVAMQKHVAAQERQSICKQAAPMIQRPEEKRMLLGALGTLVDAELLGLVVPYLDDPAVKQETVTTIMAVAEKRAKKQHAAVAKEALEKVVKVASDNPAVTKRAEELLKQIAGEK